MKLYLAALIYNGMALQGPNYNRLNDVQRQHRHEVRYLLESYHYFRSERHIEDVRVPGEKVFLDSGAYSAYTQGVEIDLPEYCRFILRNRDIIEVASVLDAIGDPLKTWQNQQEMERLGVAALPCFHSGEDMRYLEHYVERYEYITLGGMVGASPAALMRWLDTVWEKCLVDGAGRPRVKVHGFGITSIPIMKRYPWYSVDSSSWVQVSSIGAILHPDYGTIQISGTSPSRKMEGQHYNTLSPIEREHLAHDLARVGYTVEELRTSYMARRVFCMWAYCELNRRINSAGKVFINEQPGLF